MPVKPRAQSETVAGGLRDGLEDLKRLRVALVNDWLVHVRGQERVFAVLANAFPTADIFTLVYAPESMQPTFTSRTVRTSFVQRLPASCRTFRAYLPLYPLATGRLDLSDYDLVLASSSAFIHGVRVDPAALLVCYCHSPFRYIWSHYDELVGNRAGMFRAATVPFRTILRWWDLRAARRVNHFIAPSRLIAERIRTFYGRDSVIIPPPVDLDMFQPVGRPAKDYFLIVSPLMRWKRVDIAVEAFNELRLPLKIVGGGEDEKKLRRMARPNIEFLGHLSHSETETLGQLYAECRALVVPSEEDFGLAPLEAMASGRPVVAFGAGGALETVIHGSTGVLFREQTPSALAEAVAAFDVGSIDSNHLRQHAARFSTSQFIENIKAEIWRANSQPRQSVSAPAWITESHRRKT